METREVKFQLMLTALISTLCLPLFGSDGVWGQWIKAEGTAGGVRYRWARADVERSVSRPFEHPYCSVQLASADGKGHRVSAAVYYRTGGPPGSSNRSPHIDNFYGLDLGERIVRTTSDCTAVESVSVDDIP
jgi:hypothetical protein